MAKNYQETRTITDVRESEDWFEISQDGMCCGLKKKYGVEPKVGDKLTVHTKGGTFGTGEPIWWKTDEELEEERENWLNQHKEDKEKRFRKNKSKMDARYNALPECFRSRIDRFRENNPRFRVEFEAYELFCCEQAVEIANGCKSKEMFQEFVKLDWSKQKKLVPELSDGHSGNSFGCSCTLAYWYLTNTDNVVNMHGSLSPLVGSKEFGDIAN